MNPSWPAAGERFVRTAMYAAGFRARGLEFQEEQTSRGPIFHLVAVAPCANAKDHLPCRCNVVVDEWYSPPDRDGGVRLAMIDIADDVIEKLEASGIDFQANAEKWDEVLGAPPELRAAG